MRVLFFGFALLWSGFSWADGYTAEDGDDNLSRYEGSSSVMEKTRRVEAYFIAESEITTGKKSHEMVFHQDVKEIAFVAELYNYKGQDITLDWYFMGKHIKEEEFHVDAKRFQVLTYKQMHPSWIGDWKVELTDIQQNVLVRKYFFYER
ncbi:MAG: DUF2914 domain-containing protein [Gammaproteobacteria bacterium]|nr:DUF2914 domain-containing protein [Gammaproteobacteria bacterium]